MSMFVFRKITQNSLNTFEKDERPDYEEQSRIKTAGF